MSALDLGAPVIDEGTCPLCTLGDRPLWVTADLEACATCMARHYAGVALTFGTRRGPVIVRQSTLPGLVA